MRRAERNFNKPKNKNKQQNNKTKEIYLEKEKILQIYPLNKQKKRVTKRMELTLNTGNVKFYLEECV